MTSYIENSEVYLTVVNCYHYSSQTFYCKNFMDVVNYENKEQTGSIVDKIRIPPKIQNTRSRFYSVCGFYSVCTYCICTCSMECWHSRTKDYFDFYYSYKQNGCYKFMYQAFHRLVKSSEMALLVPLQCVYIWWSFKKKSDQCCD